MESFLGTLAVIAPLLIILLAANAAERARVRDQEADGWRILAFLLTVGLMLLILLAGVFLVVANALVRAQPSFADGVMGANPLLQAANAELLAWGLVASGLAGILLLLKPVRRLLARFIPIDPESTVHAVALSFTMLVVVNMLSTVGLGLDQVAQMVSDAQASGESMVTTAALWGQQLLFAALGIVGVGWPLRRGLGATLQRLGIVAPTLGQVLLGIGMAFVLVALVMAAELLGYLLGFGPSTEVENLTEQLLGGIFTTPWGVLTIALAAALGEETLMRGAVQPRFGLLLTSFLFALLHSQYGITFSTWAVFAVGLVLGWLRLRHNTTTSMVTHATYNFILALLAFMSIDILQNMR